jgi:hypothetical protein
VLFETEERPLSVFEIKALRCNSGAVQDKDTRKKMNL